MKRNHVFSVRNLVMMALLVAIQIILARYLSIQSEMFRVSFETIPLALAGMWLGPLAGGGAGSLILCQLHILKGRLPLLLIGVS